MDFQRLNYTLANEDSAVDRRLCGRAGMRLAAIAGSGSRIVSLLATQPRSIQAIDLSREQILLTELRLATLSRLECDEYRAFWGFPNDVYVDLDQRTVLRGLDLSEECRRYAIQLLQMSEDRPLIYLGRWEQTMARLSRPISAVVGKKLLDLWWDGADFGDAIQNWVVLRSCVFTP